MNSQYSEGPESTFTHDGIEYLLDPLLFKSKELTTEQLPISKIRWIFKYSTPDPNRTVQSDPSIPILVTNDPTHGYTILDGLHRTTKAVLSGATTIPAKLVPFEWLGELKKV